MTGLAALLALGEVAVLVWEQQQGCEMGVMSLMVL